MYSDSISLIVLAGLAFVIVVVIIWAIYQEEKDDDGYYFEDSEGDKDEHSEKPNKLP